MSKHFTDAALLWGCSDRRFDTLATLGTAAVLVVSRLALLASGPWEWDETIFARGMLHFELAAHFPQPPGFPGLLALGHLLLPLAGTPYRALQWLSALASIFMVWPLAHLGRRVAHPAVATSAALLVVFLPGPWLYSVRGFSTTAAVAFGLAAAALWAKDLDGRRLEVFSLLIVIALLIRPILMPTFGLLWLAGMSSVRPARRIVPGMVLGSTLIGVAVAVMVHLEGGWNRFVEPFVTHAAFHTYRLDRNTDVVEEIGLIQGVGGVPVAALLTAVSLLGLFVWWRRVGRRAAGVWLVIIGLTVSQLLFLQNRSYARYAVVVHSALAPLIAGAAALMPVPVSVITLLTFTVVTAANSKPLLDEQHRELFGAWQVTMQASEMAAERQWAVIVEPEVHPFSSYWWHVLESRGQVTPPMVLTPRAPEPWMGVDRPWVVATVHPDLYLPSLVDRSITYRRVSTAIEPFTQRRFLDAELIENPPLPVGTWWSLEHLPDGRPFMWAGPEAELWIPPLPKHSLIGLELRPAPGNEPLVVALGGPVPRTEEVAGDAPTDWYWFETATNQADGPSVFSLSRAKGYPPGSGDDRALAAQIFDVRIRAAGASVSGEILDDAAMLGLEIDGCFAAETFAGGESGVWLGPVSEIRFRAVEPGTAILRLSSPRPTRPAARLTVNGRLAAGPVDPGHDVVEVSIEIGSNDIVAGRVQVQISSSPFVPKEAGYGDDTRALGVVLHAFSFKPSVPQTGWWTKSQ